MKIHVLRPVLLVLLALSASQLLYAQNTTRKQFPGTKVSILVPDSFKYAGRFNGYESGNQKLSFMISEVHTGISHNVGSFTKEKLTPQGVELISTEELKKGNLTNYFYVMKLQLKKVPYMKFMFLIGDSSHTSVISGFVPDNDPALAAKMKEAVLSTEYDPNAVENPWDALSFNIDISEANLKFTKFSAGGTVYSKDGTYPSKGKDHTAILAGTSIRAFSPHLRREIALKRLHTLPLTDTLMVSKEDSVTIDGLPGYEFVASGPTKSKELETVYMVVLFENDQKYYILACNTNVDVEKNLAMFRKIVRSFKRKEGK